MKSRWLLPGIVSFFLALSAAAEAATLQFWRFSQAQNRLEIRADQGIQPRAQLLQNPARLVIDLPGTRLGRPKQTETYRGTITSLRVAQFERDTTRIVLELARGYTLDPTQVRFRHSKARQWTVELPQPTVLPLLADLAKLPSQAIAVPQAPEVVAGKSLLFNSSAAVPSPNPGYVITPAKPNMASEPSPSSGFSLPDRSTRSAVPMAPPPAINRPVFQASNGRLVVVIDPGHGGPDPGAVGIGGLKETDVVLDISRQVTALLEGQGVTVIQTRSAEYDLGLEPRVQMANKADAAIFVSIHANAISLSRPDVNGLETYYYNSGKALADTVHRTILEDTGVPDRRVRSSRFYVLRRTSMPSILIETGFVTGATDAARLRDTGFRSQMAAAIARGILRYLGRSS
ncbi:N-acetylmuramoyl-L-alanine amidase [Phormidium sp. CLA17]|uniref:N-acetylmuramoyl-L-alanine amidase n=1 Tax=Leptolyngbya sp. Cla-17 TaxID=2803751 RepID=UPI0014917BD8|nr:N-acetylmuramoyl-L-alanine amidase [Leptolyngbya sp. Cla-17]MBM0742193.1 N-acetylmuramoyl-L-alanine amidase [Leptolyngbya sp. Cla-17]